ncbi:hypothetical protein C8Q80DRAFT_167745 [Daedaleopsis nitida]|nr:hypothetical protein C8Q80DRAFT_167745 [Daedaleopsis nitida]
MFTMPLPAHDDHTTDSPDYMDGKPVVIVDEDGHTVERLLRLCYPVADPVLTDLKDVRLVLAAALKYEMEEATALMKRALLTFLQARPFAVWAAACTLGLADEAMLAAKMLVGFKDLPADAPPELQDVTAAMYFRLVKFHRAGGKVNGQFSFFEPDPEDMAEPRRPSKLFPLRRMEYQPRPFADLICRSSSKEEFRTHKIILGSASPVLMEKILSLPSEQSSSLPVLDLDISSPTLGAVLELCYPIHEHLDNFAVSYAIAIMSCARQLKMNALCHKMRYGPLGSSKVSEPLATYLLASDHNLTDVAEAAQGFIHGDPFTYRCIPEMEVTSALPYHRLLVNRRQTLALASQMTRLTKERTSDATARSASDTSSQPIRIPELPTTGDPWLLGILERTLEDLRSPQQDGRWWNKPDTSRTLAESVQRKLWCGSCEDHVRLILAIEKSHGDVHKAMEENYGRLLKKAKN